MIKKILVIIIINLILGLVLVFIFFKVYRNPSQLFVEEENIEDQNTKILYSQELSDKIVYYISNISGSNKEEIISFDASISNYRRLTVSKIDSEKIIYSEGNDIYFLNINSKEKEKIISKSESSKNITDLSVSNDKKTLAYIEDFSDNDIIEDIVVKLYDFKTKEIKDIFSKKGECIQDFLLKDGQKMILIFIC